MWHGYPAVGSEGRARTSNIRLQRPAFCQLNYLGSNRLGPVPGLRTPPPMSPTG